MSKTSKTKYLGGNVSVNGINKASTVQNGDNIYSNYNMSANEKAIYDYAQSQLAKNLKNINIFSNDTQRNIKNQLDAYSQQGQNIINNTYTPLINNLKNDITSRFGNFDNSSFLNKLNAIENNRSNAINNFAQDIMAKRNELVNDELANRYQYLDYMNVIQQQIENNILNYLNASRNTATTMTTPAQSNSWANLASGIAKTWMSL